MEYGSSRQITACVVIRSRGFIRRSVTDALSRIPQVASSRQFCASRHGLEPHAHPVGSSPHDDAMPGDVVKVQVELHRQIEGILQPQRSPGRRKVSNRAVYREPFGQGDLADHHNLMPRNEPAFGSLIGGSKPQRPPRGVPISRERRRRQRQDTEPRLGVLVEVKSPDEKPGLSICCQEASMRYASETDGAFLPRTRRRECELLHIATSCHDIVHASFHSPAPVTEPSSAPSGALTASASATRLNARA
jgi:hypothetical protein